MLILEIILVIVGLTAVVLSFKISEYGKEGVGQQQETAQAEPDYEVAHRLEEEIKVSIEQKQEETLELVSDELSRISNEKIMGMDEYSSQVLDKIEKNHGEVVFLYNMLNEKEEEIKKLVHHVDTVKAQIHEDVAKEYQNVTDALAKIKQGQQELKRTKQSVPKAEPASERATRPETKRDELNAIYEQEIEAIEQAENQEKQRYSSKKEEVKKANGKNHNNEIVALYKKGHSILEISRMLSLGQGEVKFVIDLYEAR